MATNARGSLIASLILLVLMVGPLLAGQLEDATSAYQKGDYVTAVRLLRPLAEEGNASAQNLLGFMYHDGEGVPRDYVRAYMWFYLAASRYDAASREFQDSMDARDLTAKSMTAGQIAEARAMAQRCQAQNYKNCEAKD